jgi:very-short-patch-repair endonuclease
MRSALTPSEEKLWTAINAGKLGVCFRRQVPVGRFIADFAAPAARLVVEVDGGYHARRGAADARRDRKLARVGWRVLRVGAELVERDIELAVSLIRAALDGSR